MRTIILFTICLISYAFVYGQENAFNYEDTITINGNVILVTYETPNGVLHETYILKPDKIITVKSNKDWEGYSKVKEIHLNIMNNKIEEYKDKKIKVTGQLFHAKTYHNIRDICIKVVNVEQINN